MLTCFLVLLAVPFIALPALGEEAIPQDFLEKLARDLAAIQGVQDVPATAIVRTIGDNTDVRAAAGAAGRIIGSLNAGAMARVIGQSRDWYEIVLPDRRVGWVERGDVELVSDVLAARDLYSFRDQMGERPSEDPFRRELMQKLEPQELGWFDKRILTLLERAAAFRQDYSDNPYVVVRGFEIGLSLTGPTLGMSFEFRE